MEKQDAKQLAALQKTVRKLVRKMGTQKALAKAVDIDPTEVCRILKGKDPRYTTAMRLTAIA